MDFIVQNTNLTPLDRSRIDSDLLQRFIEFIDGSPETLRTYMTSIKQFLSWINYNNIKRPDRSDIIKYREELKSNYKNTTVQNYMTVLKLFFRWTAYEDLYPNIADNIKNVKVSRNHKKDYLTSNQIKQILKSINTDNFKGKRDKALIVLMITCGLRAIEVSRARVQDFRLQGDNTVLYVMGKGKTDKAEYVKVPFQTESIVRSYLSDRGETSGNAPMFTKLYGAGNKPLSTRSISRIVKKIFKQNDLNSDRLTAHSLRHTAITLSLMNGCTIQEAQQFARHQSINSTLIYSHNLELAANPCTTSIANDIFKTEE